MSGTSNTFPIDTSVIVGNYYLILRHLVDYSKTQAKRKCNGSEAHSRWQHLSVKYTRMTDQSILFSDA